MPNNWGEPPRIGGGYRRPQETKWGLHFAECSGIVAAMSTMTDAEVFQLVTQIVAGVSTRGHGDRGTYGNVLAQINRLTDPWRPTDAPATDTSKVMFALNPSTTAWSVAGVPPDEAPTWEMLGFSAEYAQRWLAAGLALTHAMKWSSHYRLERVDPADVAAWEAALPECDVHAVTQWLHSSIPAERAIAWTKAGGSYYSGRDILKEFPDRDPVDLQAASRNHMTLSQLHAWLDRNVPGADIGTFIDKGYTPAAARKALDAGHTAATAPDKKGSAPVPGRSWIRIMDALKKNPGAKHNVTSTEATYRCELTHPDKDPITIRFQRNGQFIEAFVPIRQASYGGRYFNRQAKYNLTKLLNYLPDW